MKKGNQGGSSGGQERKNIVSSEPCCPLCLSYLTLEARSCEYQLTGILETPVKITTHSGFFLAVNRWGGGGVRAHG